ncbi:MAG: alkaline phosphatase family protein [Chitinophagales bacterium]|nr:alkaline phosphatase family protein [Chitinophagales bacterium]
MKLFLKLCLAAFGIISTTSAQSLKNGPMLTYLAMRETAIWVQTDKEAEVQMRYWKINNPQEKFLSKKVDTKHESAYTATLTTSLLDLDTEYGYEILINQKVMKSYPNQKFKTNKIWRWRTDAPDFSFLTGSCNYVNDTAYDRPGKSYGGDHHIFTNMAKESSNFMLWLGDNVYLREADYDSKSGIQYRYTHTRALPELQELLRATHHYAIWDDHDYGPNDAIGTYQLKDVTLQTFKDFFPSNHYGVANGQGITSYFEWSDCAFYLLDDRWFRTTKGKDGAMLGQEQLSWLIESLKSSEARFKFIAVGSQILNSAKVKENHSNYENEHASLLRQLDENNIKGVIFLTGDRHNSEISKFTTSDGDIFHDLTISPLTSGSTANPNEPNTLRVEGSYIGGKRNYALIQVVGNKAERRVEVIYKDKDGKELYRYVIR